MSAMPQNGAPGKRSKGARRTKKGRIGWLGVPDLRAYTRRRVRPSAQKSKKARVYRWKSEA